VQKPTLPIPRTERSEERSDGARLFAGRYEVRSRLGVGGMAEVMLARDQVLGRLVALKLLAPALAADPVFVERFRREATAVASLNHPNVVVVYDHGVADGQPFIAMEYIPGRTLKQVIDEGAPMLPEIAAGYARQVLAGLSAAHAVGIVHRDIKPQNLIVRADGTLKVADFGVARSAEQTVLTQLGSVIGTADYLSPEQAQGETAMAASDLYSVGVVLFELLTGRLPFTGEAALAIANQHVVAAAPLVGAVNPAVPAQVARIVDRALEKDPGDRFESADGMMAALAAATTSDPPATLVAPTEVMAGDDDRAPATATRVRASAPLHASPVMRLRRRAFTALAVLLVLAVGAFALLTRGGDGPRPVGIPHVLGVPVSEASSTLRGLGFDVRVGKGQPASEPSGTVARTRPATATAAFGTLITIIPSTGPRRVAIPPVAGMTMEAAVGELQRTGFVVRAGSAYASVPAGIVVATTPTTGTPAPPRSLVVLTVSAGPAPEPPAAQSPGNGKGHGKGDHKVKGDKQANNEGGD
jgi:hypothetical protein